MFSRPVNSGWKPVPTSSRLPTRPFSSTRPFVGSVIRDRIFSSVLLPAPLRPMIPTTSPGCTSKDTSSSAQKSSVPASTAFFRNGVRANSVNALAQRCGKGPFPALPHPIAFPQLSTQIAATIAISFGSCCHRLSVSDDVREPVFYLAKIEATPKKQSAPPGPRPRPRRRHSTGPPSTQARNAAIRLVIGLRRSSFAGPHRSRPPVEM